IRARFAFPMFPASGKQPGGEIPHIEDPAKTISAIASRRYGHILGAVQLETGRRHVLRLEQVMKLRKENLRRMPLRPPSPRQVIGAIMAPQPRAASVVMDIPDVQDAP